MVMTIVMVSSSGVAKMCVFFLAQSVPSVLSQLPRSKVNWLLIANIRGNLNSTIHRGGNM